MRYFKSKRGLILTVAVCLVVVGFASGARGQGPDPRKTAVDEVIDRIEYMTTCYVMATNSDRPKVAKSYAHELSAFMIEFSESAAFYTGKAQGYLVGLITERLVHGTKQDRLTPTRDMIFRIANEEFSAWCYENI